MALKWKVLQWTALLIVCFMTLAYMYCYNCPIPIQDQLMDEYNLSQLQYNLLFSVMAWPTMILCLFGGIISDKIGVNRMMLLTYILAIIGHVIFIVGCIKTISFNFILMVIGRTIYGTFAEIWTVVRKSFLCEFFDKDEISFAMSVNIAFGGLGNIALFAIIFEIYKLYGILFAFISGLVLLLISIILLIGLIVYIYYNKTIPNKESDQNLLTKDNEETEINTDNNNGILEFMRNIWIDIKKWDIRYWLITLILILYSGITMSWMNIASSFIHNTYGYSYSKTNTLILIVWTVLIITTPIWGYIVDIKGKRCEFLILCGILLSITHCIFARVMSNLFDLNIHKEVELCLVIIGLIFIGIVFGLYQVCTWPTVMLIVDKKTISSAYGMLTSIQNCVMALFPLIVAALSKNDGHQDQYLNVEYFFLLTSILTTIICIILWIVDKTKFENSLGISYNI